jgi:hypothetical protein
MLADPAGAALFAVPGEDWAAIEHRVDSAISLDGISHEVSQYLPGFEALVRVCKAWRAQTRPGINESAQSLVRYCGVAITQFEQLRTAVAGPLTPQLQQQVRDTLNALSQQTAPLSAQVQRSSGQVADFADVNAAVDAHVNQYISMLGPEWRSILPQASRLDNASGLVRGVWQALNSDLNALVTQQLDVTDQFIASLEIDSALAGWGNLRSEAEAYLAAHADRMSA